MGRQKNSLKLIFGGEGVVANSVLMIIFIISMIIDSSFEMVQLKAKEPGNPSSERPLQSHVQWVHINYGPVFI